MTGDGAGTDEPVGGFRLWGGAGGMPPVAELEAMGMGMSLYLPQAMEEQPDPAAPEGTPVVTSTFEVGDHLLGRDGRVGTGLLATLVDNVGGMASGLASLPDWIVTTNLALRRAAGPARPHGDLALTARVLRRGRTSVVAEVQVRGEGGEDVATAWMTSAILTPENGPPPVSRPLRRHRGPVVDDPTYRLDPAGFFGLRPGDQPGEVQADALPRLRNPWGIVHGGTLAALADAAARAAVAHPTGIDAAPDELTVTDVVLHYMSPARVGPVVAAGELLGDRADDHLVRVGVRDHGADDRPLVLAVATVRPLEA